ncbi:HNH endonuclease [Tsukamurella paurometabola]|uniref:HNH endonuclease n=1 Tax=Tsukamurella paurometabola TaxID=2061 RepID=A0ABS5NIZ6_TSUPA|nr:HNH endonuclease [Tsukamurella paurometabola]MBS4104248.1 HNH endonuclease [Tsukamurella paurometabola]
MIPISKLYPENLMFGFEKGYWDTTLRPGIQRGDDLYFWLGDGGSLVGAAVATSDLYPLRRVDGSIIGDVEPKWSGTKEYQGRVELEPLSTSPLETPSPSELLERIGESKSFQSPMKIENAHGVQGLRRYFFEDGIDLSIPGGASGAPISESDEEARRTVLRAIRRSGQQRFANNVRTKFGDVCVISGCAVHETLEAAHIVEYRTRAINSDWNGILLRADLHRLFDAGLLGIDEHDRIVLDISLRDTNYRKYHRRKLVIPKSARHPRRKVAFASRREAKHPANTDWG